MKLAHFSDNHLGYRAYNRFTETGLNQREADVFQTFQRTLDSVLEHDPDVALNTGDFYDRVRPSNYTIVAAMNALYSFQAKRNNKPFVIVAGNHETPKSTDQGCILRLFEKIPGVTVAIDGVLDYGDEDLQIKCVPTRGLGQKYERDSFAEISILAIHGIAEEAGFPSHDFSLATCGADQFDYVAMGDVHMADKLSPNAYYAGSSDYTTTNIWQEITHPKGWQLVEFGDGKPDVRFIEVAPVREVIDLSVIDCAGLTGGEIALAMGINADWNDGSLPIVRQRLLNVHPQARSEIPGNVLRDLRARALHYKLDIKLTETEVAAAQIKAGQTIEDLWLEHSGTRTTAPGVDSDQVYQAGLVALTTARESMNDEAA